MRILEILLPKGTNDRSLSPQVARKIDMLQHRMDQYVDKIMDPNTSPQGKEFLKARLRDDYYELRNTLPRLHAVAEAVTKLPLSHTDFKLVKEIMSKPIPAVIAPIYIQEIIEDDELNDTLLELEESNPGLDVRPIIAEWFKRVMPDQMFRFTDDLPDQKQKEGVLSPIHGYDDHMYKGSGFTGTGSSGDAYGKF